MLQEYALEPIVLDNWKDFRFFTSIFGPDKGRMISRFPAKWKDIVYKICSESNGFRELELGRVQIILSEQVYGFERKFVRSSRYYDSNIDWIGNAKKSNTIKPFHSIIVKNNEINCLKADDIDENSDCLFVDTSPVIRNPNEMVKRFIPFFQFSNEILFIDPYFDPSSFRYYLAFRVYFYHLFRISKTFKRIEIHAKMPRSINSYDDYINNFANNLESHIPNGREIDVYIWDTFYQEENFHPRYILTEVGGLSVDYGLDKGQDNETTDIKLLSTPTHQERYTSFQKSSSKFYLDKQITFKRIQIIIYTLSIGS